MRSALMHRDLDDVMSDVAHNVHVLDVQRTNNAPLAEPSTWDTLVLVNSHDTKIVLRQHRLTGATRIKAMPRVEVSGIQPEAYELELLPDIPFHVLIDILEILK